jgi:hypothetical protein
MAELLHRQLSTLGTNNTTPTDERTVLLQRQRSQSLSLQPISESAYLASTLLEEFPIRFQDQALSENKELLAALSEDLQLIRDSYLPSSVWRTLIDYDVKIYLHEGIPGYKVTRDSNVFDTHKHECGCTAATSSTTTAPSSESESTTETLTSSILEPHDCIDCCHFVQCGKDDVNHNRNLKLAGHIEIIAADYLAQRDKWGAGGLLLHEFAHAFDFHCLSTEHSARLKEVSPKSFHTEMGSSSY